MKKAKFKCHVYITYFKWQPILRKNNLRWKGKFGTPNYELPPKFIIEWLWFGIWGTWRDDQY